MTLCEDTPESKFISDWLDLLKCPNQPNKEPTKFDMRVITYDSTPLSSYVCDHSKLDRLPRGKCRKLKPVSDDTYIGCEGPIPVPDLTTEELVGTVTFTSKMPETN